ncbi:MAG TPA: magnesium and cobalt transport protein CorA [Desulfotomaculum sp.]|nr:magnesium and cobalt transport protein CorA [Desulfotomaculum sp.]
MIQPSKKRAVKAGLPPGTLVHIGHKKTDQVFITVIEYDEEQFQQREIKQIEECFPLKDKPTITWINISGIHELDVIEKTGVQFGLHPLTLEDIVNTEQRPKIEDYKDYIFIVLKALHYDADQGLKIEQISIIIGVNYVITIQENKKDVFRPVRERIKNSTGRIRKMGADYLVYALIDAIVDNYFVVLEQLEGKIEFLEEELITNPTKRTLHLIHQLKREMLFMRKSLWPSREVINILQRGELPFINETTVVHLKDVYDHTIQVVEIIETLRDILSETLDIYLSSISNRINDVMKILTIITTIFIPLSFVAGIYGMNFKYMPELEWRFGYPVVLIFMAVVGIVMLFFFKKKKWI